MGLFSFFKSKAEQSPVRQPTPNAMVEFDKALVNLKVKDVNVLFILLAEDGTVNRLGDGSANNTDRTMFIGINREALFSQFMTRITPGMLQHQGAYELPNRKGDDCELTILLSYRENDKSAGFKFIYGSESSGPPREVADLVRYAAALTRPWHEEQKRIAKSRQ